MSLTMFCIVLQVLACISVAGLQSKERHPDLLFSFGIGKDILMNFGTDITKIMLNLILKTYA